MTANPTIRRTIDFDQWRDKRVLITGHMGFKGAWLCALLAKAGTATFGLGFDNRIELLYREMEYLQHHSEVGDINDPDALRDVLALSRPDVIFHLAAQPLVLQSYIDPVGTFQTNVTGTANVLHSARGTTGLKVVIVVTSDKVYRNDETGSHFVEGDPLGGSDPYSASKAAAELVTKSMAATYYSAADGPRVATVRAGNVIGGGDWADHRLLPDAARALRQGKPLVLRNPNSTRPWQHVLDPLSGYLLLAEDMMAGRVRDFSSWNFGPANDDVLAVGAVAKRFAYAWGADADAAVRYQAQEGPHEARMLGLNSAKARAMLGWQPRWPATEAIRRTAEWYRAHASGQRAAALVNAEIADFLEERPDA